MVWVILCLMVDMIFLQRRFWRAHGWRALCWLAHGFVIAFATADCRPGGLSVAWIGVSPRFGPASGLTIGIAGV